MSNFDWSFILIFFLAFAVSAGATLIILRCWKFKSGFDFGDLVRKAQKQAILRVGGIAILAGLISVFIFSHFFALGSGESFSAVPAWGFLGLCVATFLLGFADDLRSMSPGWKLTFQTVIALTAYLLGFRIELISIPFGGGSLDLNGFGFVVTVFWLVALPNIINMVDGMDGLAAGVGAALCVTLGILSALMGRIEVALLCFGMAGSIGGFLLFNLPPAKIYLGDGGSYLIGFFIALSSTVVSQKGAVAVALLVVLIGLAFPIADASFAIARRAFYGLPIFRGDAGHIHHRLSGLGISRGRVLAGFYVAFVVLSVLGVSIFVSQGKTVPVLVMMICVALIGLANGLRKTKVRDNFAAQLRRILVSRPEVRYAHALSCVLDLELDRSQSDRDYWKTLKETLARAGLHVQPPSDCGDSVEAWEPVSVGIRSRLTWTLFHRNETSPDEKDWERIMGCFVPALSDGLRQWDVEPRDIGLHSQSEISASEAEFLSKLELVRSELAV